MRKMGKKRKNTIFYASSTSVLTWAMIPVEEVMEVMCFSCGWDVKFLIIEKIVGTRKWRTRKRVLKKNEWMRKNGWVGEWERMGEWVRGRMSERELVLIIIEGMSVVPFPKTWSLCFVIEWINQWRVKKRRMRDFCSWCLLRTNTTTRLPEYFRRQWQN